jgi:hypothetical protein
VPVMALSRADNCVIRSCQLRPGSRAWLVWSAISGRAACCSSYVVAECGKAVGFAALFHFGELGFFELGIFRGAPIVLGVVHGKARGHSAIGAHDDPILAAAKELGEWRRQPGGGKGVSHRWGGLFGLAGTG